MEKHWTDRNMFGILVIGLAIGLCLGCIFGMVLGIEQTRGSAAKAGAGAYVIENPANSKGTWRWWNDARE